MRFNRAARFARLVTQEVGVVEPVPDGGFNRAARFARLVTRPDTTIYQPTARVFQ